MLRLPELCLQYLDDDLSAVFLQIDMDSHNLSFLPLDAVTWWEQNKVIDSTERLTGGWYMQAHDDHDSDRFIKKPTL